MNTLHIDRKNMTISKSRNTIRVSSENSKPKTIPLSQLNRIVISSNILVESRLLRILASNDISLVLVNPRRPEEYGLLTGGGHNDANRRIQQFKASDNTEFCQHFARYLVVEKLGGQRKILQFAMTRKPELRYRLKKGLGVIERSLVRLQLNGSSLETIRGVEGAAAAAYFNAYVSLFPDTFEFTHRNRRPPRDPVNAILSLSYTLAGSLAGYRLQSRGYDPLVGFYHKLSYSRYSLSADIIEPVRPIIDEWVWRQVSHKNLRREHFKEQNGGCYMNKTGRQRYYAAWETEMKMDVLKKLDIAIRQLDDYLGNWTHG